MKVLTADFVTSAAAGGSLTGIPQDALPQVAMAGRSNVGKSSLLNALCRRNIARTSAAPGKTRLANVYRVSLEGGGPGRWSVYFVDLPGYGYARGGAGAAEELRAVAEAYFGGQRLRPERGGEANRGAAAAPSESEREPSAGASANARAASAGGAAPAQGRMWGPASAAKSRLTARDTRRVTAALLLVDSRHPGLESDIQAAEWLAAMGVTLRIVATKIDKLSRGERARTLSALEDKFGMPPLAVSAASGEGLDALWTTIASLARTGHA